MKLRLSRRLRILDFDIENRPLSYMGSDFTSAEITAIAAGFTDEDKVDVRVLTTAPASGVRMLKWFRKLWDEADIVTGHYVLRHDIPIINGALMEHRLPLLDAKLVSDTKMHLVKRKDLSMSQESIGGMAGLASEKEHMGQHHWREANRLTAKGIEETRRRVVGDVQQHKAMRQWLLDAGALKPPALWRP